MSQEQLSALLDGECNEQELDSLLDAIERDAALKQEWSRLCRTRDAITGRLESMDASCICEGVMARLDEPSEAQTHSNVVDLAARRGRSIWKPVAGLAAAASVAAVAFLAGVNFTTQNNASGIEAAQPAATSGHMVADNSTRDDDLDRYLIEHNNSLAEQGMGGGTLRYARMAAYYPNEQR